MTLAAVLAGKGSGEVRLLLPECWCPCCLPLLCQQALDRLLCLMPEDRTVLDDSCGAQCDDAIGPAWTVYKYTTADVLGALLVWSADQTGLQNKPEFVPFADDLVGREVSLLWLLVVQPAA